MAKQQFAPRRSSALVWILTALVGVFVLWAHNAPLDEIVRGPGTIVPASNPQIIQSLEGGILNEILVAEGDRVEAGQVLARLNGTRYEAEVQDFESQIRTKTVQLLRLRAELDQQQDLQIPEAISISDPDLAASETRLFQARMFRFGSELATATEQLSLRSDKVALLEDAVAQGAVPELDLINERLSAGDAQSEVDRILTEFELSRSEDISALVAEITRLEAQIAQSRDQLARSQLLAPTDGIVNTIYTTTIGGVVQSGEPIFEVTPLNDELLVETRVQPKDIAFIVESMQATVKLTAFDYTIFGSLDGKIVQISADTFEDEASPDGIPYYKVLIAVDEYRFDEGDEYLDVRPGMLADAEIHVGEKTVMQYLLKPLVRGTEALREP